MPPRADEHRYRVVFDENPLPMWVFDLETLRFLAVNEAAVSHYGWSRDEFLSMTLRDIRPASEQEALSRVLSSQLPARNHGTLARHHRRGGDVRTVEIVSHEVTWDGRAARLVLAHDVTERVEAEEALRRRAERLAAVLEASQEIAAATDDTAVAVARAVERAQQVTGGDGAALAFLDGDEVVFRHACGAASHAGTRSPRERSLSGAAFASGELLRCDDAEGDPRVDREVFRRTGVRSALALPLVYRGDTIAVLTVVGRAPGAFGDEETDALRLLGGAIAAAVSHGRELEARQRTIAERTRALEALRDREEQLRAVTDGVPEFISYVDAEERYRFVNRAYELAFGLPRDAIVGRTVRELLGQAAYAQIAPHLRAALAGEYRRFETKVETPTGTRHMSAEYVPRPPERGGPGVFSLAMDVTDRVGLEAQLRQAQKMEAIGQLAGGVAHDFNNLLTVMTSVAQLLLDDDRLSPDQRGDVEEIRRAAGRAADLTRKLLAFSRRQTLQPRLVELDAVVADAERMLRRLIREDVVLSLSLGAPGAVYADPAQLEQVLVNLVVNAADAIPGGGRVSIATVEQHVDAEGARRVPGLLPGRHAVVVVSDTGAGMPPDVAARAFEPFFTTKEAGKGTGLGLATVYGIVRQSGGAVRLESVPGAGTTVEVYLPSAQEPAPAAPAAEPVRDDVRGGSETLLLVEDEPDVRAVARRVLASRGYRVLTATDGAEALAVAARAGALDLLLTDLVMPGLGGRELAERIRERWPELPVLFTSGYAAESLGPEKVLPAGVSYVAKPFTPEALARAVRDALDRAR